MHFVTSKLSITKVKLDTYQFTISGKLRNIDELIDGPKLIAMLNRESLYDQNRQSLSTRDVLDRVDAVTIGQNITISAVERVA